MKRGTADYLIELRDKGLCDQPVVTIPIEHLVLDFSPRIEGVDEGHIKTLAETGDELPPILVHRATMAVIDGTHRVRAALLREETHIAARFFDGDRAEAQSLAVATNIAHGRPLSMADREAAAIRIFAAHPLWADRAVAAVAGLSAKKVAKLRGTAPAAAVWTDRRIGRDGRSRPLDSSRRRELAGELIRKNPEASLRQIAAQAGLALATVADVRKRVRRGESPVPERRRKGGAASSPPAAAASDGAASDAVASDAVASGLAAASDLAAPAARGVRRAKTAAPSLVELFRIFNALRRDPSLRLSESGRALLRTLESCALVARDRNKIAATVPSHCAESMARLAHGYAEVWSAFAADLTRHAAEARRVADESGEATPLGA